MNFQVTKDDSSDQILASWDQLGKMAEKGGKGLYKDMAFQKSTFYQVGVTSLAMYKDVSSQG